MRYSGLYVSTSGGATWEQKDYMMNDGYALAYASGSIYQGGSWYDEAANISTMGIFKSTDQGSTWTRPRLSADTGEVRVIAISPTDPNLILAGGRRYDGRYQSYGRMFRSINGGLDWTEVGASAFGDLYDCINGMAFDPWTPTRVLAAASKGVYMSEDGA